MPQNPDVQKTATALKELENLHKQRRRLWRGIYSGKLEPEVFNPSLGKILDSILKLQHFIKLKTKN